MNSNRIELFIKLVKLKSYLASMIDNEEDCPDSFYHTDEFLSLRYPEEKKEIISLLKQNNIKNDSDIIFDDQIHQKFKEITEGTGVNFTIDELLNEVGITSEQLNFINNYLEKYKLEREDDLKEIVGILLHIAKIWVKHQDIENTVDDFALLNEEDVLRPDEEAEYSVADNVSVVSLTQLAELTNKYLILISKYFFKYGGNVQLKKFISQLDDVKNMIMKDYSDLFEKSGLPKK